MGCDSCPIASILNFFKFCTNLYDLVTDILFTIHLCNESDQYDLFLASIIILSVSTAVNVCFSCCVLMTLSELEQKERPKCYWLRIILTLPFACFMPVDVLHKMFVPKDEMYYSDGDDNDFLRVICINTCCLENIPQIVINCIYVTRIGQWQLLNILNVIGSILSIGWDIGCRWFTCKNWQREMDSNMRGEENAGFVSMMNGDDSL